MTIAPLKSHPTILLLLIVASLSAQYVNASSQCAPPPSGMVSFWTGDGDSQDAVGTNSGKLSGDVSFANGYVSEAFSFDGSPGMVNVPNVIDGLKELTLMAWFLYDDSSTWRWIYGTGPDWSDVGAAVAAGGNVIRYHFTTSAGFVRGDGTTVMTPGTWHHVAISYDGITVKGFLDGSPDFTASASGSVSTKREQAIGAGYWKNNEYFKGLIDEVAVFNRALTSSEIQTVYGAQRSGMCRVAVTSASTTVQVVQVVTQMEQSSTNSSVQNVQANGCDISCALTMVQTNLPTVLVLVTSVIALLSVTMSMLRRRTRDQSQQVQTPTESQVISETKYCPACAHKMRYILEYKSWWCDQCNEYKDQI